MADDKREERRDDRAASPQGNQLNIELPEQLAEGQYANLAIITHSASEFVADFIQVVPNVPKAKVKSRVILAPLHAKRLLAALQENVAKYEAQYGSIPDPSAARAAFPAMSFNTPQGQA